MFRYGKIIDSNSKVSRSDRFAEMSKQQRLIEQKKQEIKLKFEERRRQEAEETLKKLASKTSIDNKGHKDTKALVGNRMQSWKNDERWKKKSQVVVNESSSVTNAFSNDGSFIEEFKKIAQDKDTNITKNKEKCSSITATSSCLENRQSQQPSIPHFPYVPPTPSYSTLSSEVNAHSLPPHIVNYKPFQNITDNRYHSVNPVHPYQKTRIQHDREDYGNKTTKEFISCGLNEMTYVPPSPPPTFQPPVLSHHSTFDKTGFNMLPVSSNNIQSPTPVEESALNYSNSGSRTQKPADSGDGAPNKREIFEDSTFEKLGMSNVSKSDIAQEEKIDVESDNNESKDVTVTDDYDGNDDDVGKYSSNEDTNGISKEDSRKDAQKDTKPDEELENIMTIARIVAECGDHMEQVLLQKRTSDAELQFLVDKFSPPYIAYRHMVEKLRKENDPRKSDAQQRDDDGNYTSENQRRQDIRDKSDRNQNSEDENFPPKSNAPSTSSERSRNVEGGKTSKVPADEDSESEESGNEEKRKRKKRRSRWAPENCKMDISYNSEVSSSTPGTHIPTISSASASLNVGVTSTASLNITSDGITPPFQVGQFVAVGPTAKSHLGKLPGVPTAMISQVTRKDPALVQYALQAYGKTNLTDEEWKTAEDHYKLNLLYQDMLRKRAEIEKLQAAGKFKYEYDSDEDTRGGTWEHKLRDQEMAATKLWADELTEKAKGKHHIGDFLPPDELERFMEKYDALKEGREPDLSDYKEYKLKQDNVGFQMLQKLGWVEGQGLGFEGGGIVDPVNKAPSYFETHGLGIEKPDEVTRNDDEYDAYRKRMMLAYRFRPNPLNNPRRPYY